METEHTARVSTITAKVPDIAVLDGSPWLLFGGIFFVASIGGLAALLRSGQELTKRQIASALLNSGILGLIIALFMYRRYGGEDPHLLFAVSTLAGFGGATAVDMAVQYFRKGVIDIFFQWLRKKLGLPEPPKSKHKLSGKDEKPPK